MMIMRAGMWIDHRRAVVVKLTDDKEDTAVIMSNADKHVKTTGGSRTSNPHGPQDVVAGDRIDRKLKQQLDHFYENVAQSINGARSIFIMGPGAAKDELKKHLETSKHKPAPKITVEARDKMTDTQILADVRSHFT